MNPLLVWFLGAGLLAQDGWGGSQAEPVPDPEPPSGFSGAVVPATPAVAQQGFVMPTLLSVPQIPWPEGAPFEPASVSLVLVLGTEGQVTEVSATAGEEPFLSLALLAAEDLQFTPAYEDGAPVEVELPFEWPFTPPPINLSGQLIIVGDGDNSPARVSLFLDGQPFGETDEKGAFAARLVPAGAHQISIEDPNLTMAPLDFVLEPDQAIELNLVALPEGQDNVAVGVYTRKRSEVVTRSLSAEELRTTPGTMGDPVRAVQNLPGVVRTPFDSGWLIVRGGSPRDTGVFIDGQRVPLVYHLGGFTSVLHPSMVDTVDFMPGGFGPRYGRAIAGAVDLSSQAASQEYRVEAGADLVHAGAFVQAPLNDEVSMAASLRRSYLDRIVSAVTTPEQAAIVPRFYDWQVRVDGQDAGVFYLGYKDSINAPTGLDGDTVQVSIVTHRVLGRVERDTSLGRLSLRPVFADDAYYLDYSEDRDERRTRTGSLRIQMDSGEGQNWGLQTGLDTELSVFRINVATNCGDDACPGIVKQATMGSTDPYMRMRIGDANGSHLLLGGRIDTLLIDSQQLRWAPSPRVAAVVQATENWTLVGDAGVYRQYPPIEWAVGLPTGRYLDLEQSRGFGGGAHWQAPQLSFDVDAYWRQMDQLTIFEEDGSTGQGQGKAYGIETLSRFRYGGFSGWVAYTYSRSLRRDEAGDGWRAHTYDQPHYFVLVGAYQLPKDWSLSARFRAGSGYPREPDADDALDILTQNEVPLDMTSTRLPSYHSLDIKISRLHDVRAWELEYYLDIQNVYNRRIPEPVITGIDDRNTAYGFGLTTLPIFGIKGAYTKER